MTTQKSCRSFIYLFHSCLNFFFSASSKKLQRINLSVCPKGIETFDVVTGETMHRISIYDISYCSADATYSNVFAFIAGNDDQRDPYEDHDVPNEALKCYAFYCSNRKMARLLAQTVAKTFERAYDQWTKTRDQKKFPIEKRDSRSETMRRLSEQSEHFAFINSNVDDTERSLLIDFNTESTNRKKLLKNTWVSFDDSELS